MAKLDLQTMRQRIEEFLSTNPEPSDEEFHKFAESMGYDPQTLEAVAYEMLSDEIGHEADEGDIEQEDELIQHEASASARQRIMAASTHFEVGEGGEYGEGRPGDESDDDCTAFDLAVDAPETKAVARLQVAASWFDENSEGEEVDADAGAPGDKGLSEQQLVLQGDESPEIQDSNSVMVNDGAPVEDTSDNQTQNSTMVDGPLAEAALHDSADQAFLMNDGAPELQLTNAATRLKASAFR